MVAAGVSGFGAAVRRKEDPELLRGGADFVGDISLPGMAHMAFLRSSVAHGRIRDVDVSRARRMPGVIRVVTGKDVAGKLMPLPCIWVPGGVESHFPRHPMGLPGAGDVLATDRVRFIGDPVAAVVAETRQQAEDAARAISVDYEELPVVVTAKAALAPGAPQLHDTVPGNLNAYWTAGDMAATDAAIERAEVVVRLEIRNQRTINSPIEPRGAIGSYDAASGEYTLWASTQSPHNHRLLLAFAVLGIPFTKLRVIAPNVGGSFGTKGYLYPDMPLVLLLARELGRPVKWVDTREGLMRSTVQGRDHVQEAVLAGTRDGHITAVRCTSHANLGAYPSTIGPGVATAMMGRSITGTYDVPNAFCEVYAAFTNTVPLGAQRGSGRAEATFMIERLVDRFASEIDKDPVEVRRLNLIAPEKFPYDNGLGWTYDSGSYPEMLERAVALSGYDGMKQRKAQARKRGKRLGVGVSCFVAVSGVGPSPRMGKEGMLGGTWESANLRLHPTGELTVTVGSKPHGQAHDTVFAQIAAGVLGLSYEKVEVLHSDTERAPYGQGSYGSRSLSVCGPAVHDAAMQMREKLIRQAAHMFGADTSDIVCEDGKLYVRGQLEMGKTLQEVGMAIWYGWDLAEGLQPSCETSAVFDPPDFNFPAGAHVAVVEIDEETGEVELVEYTAVNDVGEAANPMVLEGQVHGGVVHGVGQALLEEAVYGEDGRLMTDSFETYAIPRSTHVPTIRVDRVVTPTPHNALGAKGAGEIGTVGAAAAIGNAVRDALSDLGITHLDMPYTPERVWRAMREAEGR